MNQREPRDHRRSQVLEPVAIFVGNLKIFKVPWTCCHFRWKFEIFQSSLNLLPFSLEIWKFSKFLEPVTIFVGNLKIFKVPWTCCHFHWKYEIFQSSLNLLPFSTFWNRLPYYWKPGSISLKTGYLPSFLNFFMKIFGTNTPMLVFHHKFCQNVQKWQI